MVFANKCLKTLGICLATLIVGCRPAPDFEALRGEILDLHRQFIDAHLRKDVGFMAKDIADGFFSVADGEIRRPSREDIRAEFDRYLDSTTFTEYRDLCEPIVGFSKDGSLAWFVAQVKVAGRERTESGVEKDFDVTWAWITLYERKGNRWSRLGEASNFKQAF